MKKYRFLFFLIFFYSFSLTAKINIKNIFQSEITAPTLVEYCNDTLWTYSIFNKKIYNLFPKTGRIINTIGLLRFNERTTITAFGCFKNTIVFSTTEPAKTSKLYTLSRDTRLKEVGDLKTTDLIRDIFCNSKLCFILGDKVWTTENLIDFIEFLIPDPQGIQRIFSNKDINPFADWQDKHILSGPRYFKGLLNNQNDLFILDSQRANVIVYEKLSLPSISDSLFKKFGNWGGWEGEIMYPKGFAFLDNLNLIAISDAGTKMIYLFSTEGTYMGKLGKNSSEEHFSYPLDLTINQNSLYIADFKDNTIYGIELVDLGKKHEPRAKSIDDLLSKDLFKNKKVIKEFHETRCLNCHDGQETLLLDKFVNLNKNHHPIHVKLEGEVDLIKNIELPLWMNMVECATCHNSHHEAHKTTSNEIIPKYLRKPYAELCNTCHQDKVDPKNNHINLNRDKKGEKKIELTSCSGCHLMHNSEDKLTIMGNPELCFSCHSNKSTPVAHPLGNKTLKGKETNLTCFSCHGIHGTLRNNHFAKHSKPGINNTCLDCHDEYKEKIGTNKHLSPKKEVITTHKWPGKESVCLDCHKPHEKRDNVRAICIDCHSNKEQVHKKKAPIAATQRAEGIILENEVITCTTCHEPHGLTKNPSFLRDREVLINFCSSCHDKTPSSLFDNFHKISQGENKK